jgi:hypothetical protein
VITRAISGTHLGFASGHDFTACRKTPFFEGYGFHSLRKNAERNRCCIRARPWVPLLPQNESSFSPWGLVSSFTATFPASCFSRAAASRFPPHHRQLFSRPPLYRPLLSFPPLFHKFVKLFTHGTKVLSLTYRGLQANLPRACWHYFSPDLVS